MANKKRRVLDEKELKQLEYLSGIRLPYSQMAALFGISESTFARILIKQPAAREFLERGRAAASQAVRGTLYQIASGRPARIGKVQERDGKKIIEREVILEPALPPDVSALKFWCETQEDFKRVVSLDVSPIDVSKLSDEELEARTAKALTRLASRKHG